MQFPNLDEEDGDFNISNTSRSRLSSLFNTERSTGDVNQALTFTAPKQPKKNDNSQASQDKMKLIFASSGNAYKLVDGNYVSHGKLGCAILGSHEVKDYKLLLYKQKQAQVSNTTIVPSFKFYVQPNNYATFYDDVNDNWSINFDSESALLNFTKQIAITKANAQKKDQISLTIQDVLQGDGPMLEIGDSAEVKYTGWLLTNYTFGQVFDSNMESESAFRLRLGKKVIKGWSEGLVGAQKGTKRLLVIPPNLAYGAEGMGSAVPPNSTLIFEILVNKVKVSREASHSPSPLKTVETIPEKKPEVVPRHSISQEDNIRLRGASISEQLSQSPKKDKAQLISRMAKMGTATLPFQGAIVAQADSESENENEEEIKEEHRAEQSTPPVQLIGSRTSSPKPSSRSTSRKNSEQLTAAQPLQLQHVQESNQFQLNQQPNLQFYPQAALPNQQPYGTPTNAYSPFQPQMPTQFQMPQMQYSAHNMPGVMPHVTSIVDTHLPMLITESRNQNTEVRLSLSKITEKVDTVIQKIDDLRVNQGRSATLSHSSFMDSAILVQSIEKIVQDNNQLKEDLEAKNNKVQSLNEKICDLLQRNQGFFEESNSMLEQKSDSLHAVSAESQAKLLTLEREKLKLSTELSDALHKLGAIESEVENYQNQESRLKQKLQESEKKTDELECELNTLKNRCDSESEASTLVASLQNEIKGLSDEKSVLRTELEKYEEKYNILYEAMTQREGEFIEVKEGYEKMTSELKNSTGLESGKLMSLEQEIKNIQAEKAEIISKFEDVQKRLSDSNKSKAALTEQINSLENELESALIWKEKLDVFKQKTRQMKESYESERERLMNELESAQSASSSADFSGEIRKVMNILFKSLQGKFESNLSYTGSEVLSTTLQTIKALTIQMLQRQGQRSDTMTKETAVQLEKAEPNLTNSTTENLPSGSSAPLNGSGDISEDKSAKENIVEENGITDNASNSSDSSSVRDSQSSVGQIVEHSSSENQLPANSDTLKEDSKTSSNSQDQILENDTDIQKTNEESKEEKELKSSNDLIKETKSEILSRISPDLSQQQSATNFSDNSLFETGATKVIDGEPSMHA